MDKTAIKNFAIWARQKLIKDILYKAGLLGISDKGIAEELPQSTDDLKFFDIGTKDYTEVSGKEIKQREALVEAIKSKERDTKNYIEAFEFIIEEVAYTWFNRLIAIRFMEVNGYLPSGIRVLSSENSAKNEPDFVTNPFGAELGLTPAEEDLVFELKDQNKSDELFRMLFIKQCNKLHEILPHLFEETNDYTELLLTISFIDKDGVVYKLVNDIDEDDFNVEKEGQVEIIGWMYQFYNTELKDAVFARAKGKKIEKDQVPAATQLFTPDWIVRYMLENSLGRLWYEGHSDSNIKENWRYYIDEVEQEVNVQVILNEIREEYKSIKPEDIKLIDPCMGSGHILVYAFDVLLQIYESCGYTQRDAARLIVEKNIFGLDIDKRASQLAYFAIMMKAREYDRRFLTRGVIPHVYDVPNIENVHPDVLNAFEDCATIAKRVYDSFTDGKEYGSLITPDVSLDEIEELSKKIEDMQASSDDLFSEMALNTIIPLIDIVKMMVQKYDVVVTNPPYMTLSNAGAKLNKYVKKHYADSKLDMFAVFMEHCTKLIKQNRFQAMITMHSWMFLSSYEKLREKLMRLDLINMAHLGARAFDEIGGEVVQTTTFVFRKSHTENLKGVYCRLIEPNTQLGKEEMFLSKENRYESVQDNFSKIPGSPIAYWVSDNIVNSFENGVSLGELAIARNGMKTGNNNRFIRLWWEINIGKASLYSINYDAAVNSKKKWFPYNKGGSYRRWYGNNDYVVNWDEEGYEIFKCAKIDKRNVQDYPAEFKFKPSLSWSLVTSGKPSFRYKEGNLSDIAGMSVFANKESIIKFLALLNSRFANEVLELIAPTINFQTGDIARIPFLKEIDSHVKVPTKTLANIKISKIDWDSFETSWDFTMHPLVRGASVKDAFTTWEQECEERFNTLKANEEELNRIFIDIYGLQDELTPEVEDKDVTVRKADLQRDIKSLVSYAVGCMFGRYSLDVEGLAYAGGEWDDSKYSTFIPDADNCIPITDEEYFEDDIVGRFEKFLRVVYGDDTLEENLDFIAKALGNKGNTSREIIRNYFLNDFIKDHNRIYQKRPIYWMYDSGKQNGFKAIVYMHRWNADTTGNMRVEYLHRMQKVYENEIERMQEIIDNSTNTREVSNATKRKEKLQKQFKETKDYDVKIAHLALSRIDIDLDDGVKVNYEKVQTPDDGKVLKVLAKI